MLIYNIMYSVVLYSFPIFYMQVLHCMDYSFQFWTVLYFLNLYTFDSSFVLDVPGLFKFGTMCWMSLVYSSLEL